MKKRISITLDEEVLRKIDVFVDTSTSRSEIIESVLKKYLEESRCAVILAGGNPEKLFIPELKTFRPLVQIGKKKLIEYQIEKCRESGFVNIFIIGFFPLLMKIQEVVGNGESYGVRINYIQENEELGSGKTLELAKPFLKTHFLFLPCDQWFDFNLKSLYKFHIKQGGVVTLGIYTRADFEWHKGVVDMDGNRIVSFEEFPRKVRSKIVSTFTGCMSPEIFKYIPQGRVKCSLQEDVFPRLAKDGKLFGYNLYGNWVNIHSYEDLRKAVEILRKG